jgi:hypothetical protein
VQLIPNAALNRPLQRHRRAAIRQRRICDTKW